jgi:hypothetical protein
MTDRKEIVMTTKRVPLKKLIHGHDFVNVIENLKTFRAQFAEQEILYKAKVYFTFDCGEASVSVRRPETDNEMTKRHELERVERLAKEERKQLRLAMQKERAEKLKLLEEAAAEVRRKESIKELKAMARKLHISAEELLAP